MKAKNEVEISTRPSSAAGPKAVGYALNYASERMSPAKAFKLFRKLNQKNGIDCPGCAWPDPKNRSKLGEFCENGVKAISEEAMTRYVDATFFETHSLQTLREKSDYWLGQQGRLTQPVIRKEGEDHYRAIEWVEAFDIISEKLKGVDDPDRSVFYTSGRTSNEAAFLYQLFVRKYGTNNLPDCSNMCHESSGIGLKETLGIGKGSVTLEDFDEAELIIIMGQNPGTNHPRMLTSLERAKKRGARIISVNPLKEVGLESFKNPQKLSGALKAEKLTDKYLQVRINEDVALLKAWMKYLLIEGMVDQDFVDSKTQGLEDLVKDLDRHDFNELVARTSLSESDVLETAGWIGESKRIIICWAMGLTQHVNGVDNIREVVNLLLMRGSIGKKGAGTCPVRGHSNVQGDRTMGIWERPTKEMIDKLKDTFGFEPPRSVGYNVVEAIEAMAENKVDFFLGLGGNLLPAAPDTFYTQKAFERCGMTVHISTKLNRTHLYPGQVSLILPCLGRTDKDIQGGKQQMVTVENSMGVVHGSQGMINPTGNLMSEPAIIASIASRVLDDKQIDWQSLINDYDNIRDLISRAIDGFENFNQRLKQSQGFDLPNGARIGEFHTTSGKAEFTINQLPEVGKKDHQYLMMTIRSHDQFNTTIYGLNDRYRGISNGRMIVFMNNEDMRESKLAKGDQVEISNNYDGENRSVTGFTVVPYDIPSGCVATYYPEANPLVPLQLKARGSHTPASKSIFVNIRPS